ncbi:MAG: outer membrane protein assembly factor BamD [Pseudomonadota bacterium]
MMIRAATVTLVLGLTLAGCGERFGRDVPVESRSAQDLFLSAERELERGRPAEAGELFDEVERLYPYSEWAKRAMIMSAFSYYDAQQFELSRSSAQRYLDFFPADQDAAYAQYLIALSYYDQIADISRDQSLTFDALQALRETIERYPESDYTKSAELKFDLALDHLAGKEMEVGRYYLKKGHYPAAINRFRVVVEEFQTSQHTPEALHRLVESYVALGLTDEAQTAAAILGYNYQGTEWYADSYALLTDEGLSARRVGGGWLSRIYRQVIQGRWL